ncbi:MAG: hypothetical protein QXR17_08640 [Candidatus Bathyarchaeia archaeon]
MTASKVRTRVWGVNIEVKERKEKVGATLTVYVFRCSVCGKLIFGLTENIVAINAYNHLQTHISTHPQVLEKIVIEYRAVEI